MEAKKFDKIEAYLAGELSAAEAKAFDAQVAADEALSLEIDQHTIAHNAIEMLIEEDLRSQLQQLKAEETTTPATAETKVVAMTPKSTEKVVAMQPRKRRSLFPRLAAAASVAILLGFFGLQYNATSNSSLLAAYETSDDMGVSIRGGNQTTTPLAEGATAFNAKEYTKAIKFYQSIPSTSERYNEAQFYAGNSLYKNAQYAEAAAQYGKVAATGDIRYKDLAEWYQVLALLANNQLDATNTLLTKIATDSNHSYHQKAQKLNSSLNSTMRQLLH